MAARGTATSVDDSVWKSSADGQEVRWEWHNKYTTTIHAVNSVVVKCSRLTKIQPLYRGWTGATLPQAFFVEDEMGVKGGIEYGFSSTTVDREQVRSDALSKVAKKKALVHKGMAEKRQAKMARRAGEGGGDDGD